MTTLALLGSDWAQWGEPFTAQWIHETTASVLVGTCLGALGCFVVLRRMALIGDALSHAVLPGVVIALIVTGSTGVGGLLLGALIAGLTTAVLINVVGRFSRTKEDSAIGIVFTALFALGVILLSNLPRGTHFDLKCFLFGDPLAVGTSDLILMAVIAPLVILTLVALYHPLKLASFDPIVAAAMGLPVAGLHYLLMGMLSATVVAGLKTTGVILVVAMLITPASAAYQLTNRLWVMLTLSALFGAISAAAGMSLAFVTNSPTGPAMVLVATVIFSLAMLLSPSHGVVFDRIRRWKMSRHIEEEDLVKALYKLTEPAGRETPGIASDALASESKLSHRRVLQLLDRPAVRGLIERVDGLLRLTAAGRQRAVEMVRAHRLWESFLADQTQIKDPSLHEEADRLEHAHELADAVDQSLGHPARDPHGEVIPREGGRESR